MKLDVLEQLVGELIATNKMLVVIDSGGAVSEMYARDMRQPEFKDGWATAESPSWHVHLDLKSVDGVQFVEGGNHGPEIPQLYYVRLSNAAGNTLLRFYFPNPWTDEDEKPTAFQPEKLRLFEEFRDRYVGREGIVFVQRPRQGAAAT